VWVFGRWVGFLTYMTINCFRIYLVAQEGWFRSLSCIGKQPMVFLTRYSRSSWSALVSEGWFRCQLYTTMHVFSARLKIPLLFFANTLWNLQFFGLLRTWRFC
jgi:hypothetical protein